MKIVLLLLVPIVISQKVSQPDNNKYSESLKDIDNQVIKNLTSSSKNEPGEISNETLKKNETQKIQNILNNTEEKLLRSQEQLKKYLIKHINKTRANYPNREGDFIVNDKSKFEKEILSQIEKKNEQKEKEIKKIVEENKEFQQKLVDFSKKAIEQSETRLNNSMKIIVKNLTDNINAKDNKIKRMLKRKFDEIKQLTNNSQNSNNNNNIRRKDNPGVYQYQNDNNSPYLPTQQQQIQPQNFLQGTENQIYSQQQMINQQQPLNYQQDSQLQLYQREPLMYQSQSHSQQRPQQQLQQNQNGYGNDNISHNKIDGCEECIEKVKRYIDRKIEKKLKNKEMEKYLRNKDNNWNENHHNMNHNQSYNNDNPNNNGFNDNNKNHLNNQNSLFNFNKSPHHFSNTNSPQDNQTEAAEPKVNIIYPVIAQPIIRPLPLSPTSLLEAK